MGKSLQPFWGSHVAIPKWGRRFDARETLGLETHLGVLGVRQNCWADLEVLRVPSNTELTQSTLISLRFSNVFLSLRQWGNKAVCKVLGFFLWCYFYLLFVGFVKPVLVLQEHWPVSMGFEFDSEVRFIFFQWKLRVSTQIWLFCQSSY